ncbi:hypothetical protein DMZ43_14150 [Meridianimaribacter sp. CL38]|uniref:hypothetical protein n=1 Tax=Meridianimaribacter sp. CL38 TaxID=2213021 RepID=UPI00103B6468|nr:hypothetical protein [Meridianimaribacter sp. CL38]TBV25010.1 hypothetical protein DMZ43_14150 [Meridianimaribacter sp. CL38]
MILVSKYIVPKGYVGVTIFPFVFLKYKALKEDVVLLNHEKIHLKQQLELLIIPFYLLYLIEFFIRLVQYKNMYAAYKNISFEREAYFQEAQLDYLKYRRLYSFLKYL